MKIIVAPDKFKGSLTSFEACKCIEAGIKQVDENADVHCFPMADGGDGFAAVMQYYLQTQTICCATVDPLNRTIDASYQWDEANKTAIIELASASGLALLKDDERNPLLTSSFGTGLLIQDAVRKGAEKIILGLGGSATNDAGTGILKAFGFAFLDADDNELESNGGNLLQMKRIIAPYTVPNIIFEVGCDVLNTMHGENGAAFIYAPQKGADRDAVVKLDNGLRNFHQVLLRQRGRDLANVPGAGAAGGVAVGLMAFFRVRLQKGIDMIVTASGIDAAMQHADLLITGEGMIDQQSKEGKVVGRISEFAKENNVPAIGLCGSLLLEASDLKQLGLSYASSICNGPSLVEGCIDNAARLLQEKTSVAFSFFKDSIERIHV